METDSIAKWIKRVPTIVWLIASIQAGAILLFLYREIFSSPSVWQILKTILNATIFFWLIEIVVSRLKTAAVFINLFLIFFFTLLIFFHYYAKSYLDYFIIIDNWNEIFSHETSAMILSEVGTNFYIFLGVLILFLVFSQIRWKMLYGYPKSKKPVLNFSILLVLFIFINILHTNSLDEIIPFSESVVRYYRVQKIYPDPESIATMYPEVNHVKSNISNFDLSQAPNIFFIVMESFNANFVENKTKDGKEYTPYFNSLISQGLYIKHFYGNSVVTARGHFSILFSTIPSFKGKVFEKFSTVHLQSLPEILKKAGYTTIYDQGHYDLNFDNTRPFLSRNGFEIVRKEISYKIKDQTSYHGVKDSVLYNFFFKFVDSLHNKSKHRKFFGFLATISNHGPHIILPYNSKLPFPYSFKFRERFANSIFIADSYLHEFFDELRKRKYLNNSIIVITGDHSYPADEHGNHINAEKFYEENSRTPCLIIWKNHIKPHRIENSAWSQLDIAPTILDLLNIKMNNHFVGKSIIQYETTKRHVIYLVQPYDGVWLSTVDYPFKYVHHLSLSKFYLFNLDKDPEETINLIANTKLQHELKFLKEKEKLIGINQFLIEHDRIWPK